jgi:chromosome segregation ATPase
LDEEAYYQHAVYGMFGKQYEKMATMSHDLAAANLKIEEADRRAEEFKQEAEAAKREIEEYKHREETAKRQQLENARELKKEGMPAPRIAKITGMSVEEIEKL